MDFAGKVVVVTGASRGIGAEIAKSFGARGAFVVINYLNRQRDAEAIAHEIAQTGGQAIAIAADVRDDSHVQRLMQTTVETLGGIDVIVNNALASYTFNPKHRKLAWDMPWSDMQAQLDGSLRGAFHVCRAAVPHMAKQGAGRIVNITTNLVQFPVVPYHDYTTAKSALLGFTRTLATELGAFGITVNCVAPGLTHGTDSSRETQEDTREAILRLTPLGRLATPADIAGATLFFASDLAGFITGQCLYVDGGLVMG